MVQAPDFGFEAMSHEELAAMVHGAPGSAVNAPVADRLTMIATHLNDAITLVERARTNGALNWQGPAAAAADQLVRQMSEYSRIATEHATFFHEQAAQQGAGADRVRHGMPMPVPDPLSPPPDLGNPGMVGLTESLANKEVARNEASARAHELMNQWATDTVARVDQMSALAPLPPAPGPNTGAGGPAISGNTVAKGSQDAGRRNRHYPRPQLGHSTPPVATPVATPPPSQPVQSTTPAATAPITPAPAGSTPLVQGPAGSDPGSNGLGRPPFTPVPGGGTGRFDEPGRTSGGRPGAQPGEPAGGRAGGPTTSSPGRGVADPLRANTSSRGPNAPGRPLTGGPAETAGRSGSPLAGEPNRTGAGSAAPGGGGRRGKGDEDKEHRRRYGLESDEYFGIEADEDGVLLDPSEDGRYIAPPVIGEQ